jgi:hypothetical protein
MLLFWWVWSTDGSAPGEGYDVTVTAYVGYLCWALSVFVFPHFCVLRIFRTVDFVAATFVRQGRKRLPYWRAEGEFGLFLCGRLLGVCIVWFRGGITVCPHIILNATLFYLLCILFCDLRAAFDVFEWRVNSTPKMFVACFSPVSVEGVAQPFFLYSEATYWPCVVIW